MILACEICGNVISLSKYLKTNYLQIVTAHLPFIGSL